MPTLRSVIADIEDHDDVTVAVRMQRHGEPVAEWDGSLRDLVVADPGATVIAAGSHDPEVNAMSAISSVLFLLPEDACARILAWANARFG